MIIKQIKTDGIHYGLAAYLVDKQDYLKDPRQCILYRNLDVLKSALYSAGYTDAHDYVIVIKIDDTLVELSKCRVTNEGYVFYKDDVKYYVEEDRERRLCNMGYLDFEHPTYDKNLMKVFEAMMDFDMEVRKCKSGLNNRVLRFKLANSTGAINLCTLTTLIHINNERRQHDLKAIPFIKDKKNNSIIIFSDKDIYDRRSVEEELSIKIMDLIALLKDKYNTNVTYEPVDFIVSVFYND